MLGGIYLFVKALPRYVRVDSLDCLQRYSITARTTLEALL